MDSGGRKAMVATKGRRARISFEAGILAAQGQIPKYMATVGGGQAPSPRGEAKLFELLPHRAHPRKL